MTVPHSGKGWRLAPALIALEAEADRIAPRRRRTSDGSIGDQKHKARKSNHNPDGGFVDAFDLSHDPANGMDAHGQVRAWVARQDPRLEEVISNRRIWTYERRSEGWRPYKGDNPHTLHAHITVKNSHRFDTSPWFGSVVPIASQPLPPPYNPQPAVEDDMYARDTKTGAIYAISHTHYQHLSGPQWADRQKEGAKAVDMAPELVFHFCKSRIRA